MINDNVKRLAEVVRTKFWEAMGSDIPAEEWLGAAIEALRDKDKPAPRIMDSEGER